MPGQGTVLTLTFRRTGHCTWQWVEARAAATQAATSPWLGQCRDPQYLCRVGAWRSPSIMISLVNTVILEVSREGYG